MSRKPSSPLPIRAIPPSSSPHGSSNVLTTPARSRSKESPLGGKSRGDDSPVRTSFKRSRSKESPVRASPGILRSGTNRTSTPPTASPATTPTSILRGSNSSCGIGGGNSLRTGGDCALSSKKESPPLPYRVSFYIDDESKTPSSVRRGQENRVRMNAEGRGEEQFVGGGGGRGKVSSSTEALGGGGKGSSRGRWAAPGEEVRGSRRGRPGGSSRGNGNRKSRKLRRHVSDVTDDLRKTGERMRRLEGGEYRSHHCCVRRSTSDVGYRRPRHHALADPVRPYPSSSNLLPGNKHRRDKWKHSPPSSFGSNHRLPQGFINYHIRLDGSQENVAQNQFTKYFEGLDGPDRLAIARVARDQAWAETIKDFEEPHEPFQDTNKFPWGEQSPKERRRRLAVAVVGTVSLLLLVASVLFVIVTLHQAPDIDSQVRKENEDIFRDLQAAYGRNNTDLGGATSEDVSEDVLAPTSAEPFPSSSSFIHSDDNVDNSGGVRSADVENSGNEG